MRLFITAAYYPVTKDATTENKNINNLVDDWADNENIYDYLIRMQNKYNINIWFYQPSTEDDTKVEILLAGRDGLYDEMFNISKQFLSMHIINQEH